METNLGVASGVLDTFFGSIDGPTEEYPATAPVGRTLAWLSKCQAIGIRIAKRAANYLVLIELAFARLWYRRRQRLIDAAFRDSFPGIRQKAKSHSPKPVRL